eukprot:391865_1
MSQSIIQYKSCRKCSRPVDLKTKFKTCCKTCAVSRNYDTMVFTNHVVSHDPICEVRYHEYKHSQNNATDVDEVDRKEQEQNTNDSTWRCVLCNYSNKPRNDQCKMCDKDRPNNKRKWTAHKECPTAKASPFHACTQTCVDLWGVTIDDEPPKKKQKRNPHIHNNEQNTNNAVDTTWECALCTFQNNKMALQCQVCEVERNGADEEILKRLKSQHDELKQTNDDLDNCYIDRYVEIIADKQQHNTEKNDKEEMDDEPEIISNCDEEFSDHESDNDVAVDMFKNGLTPEIVKRKTKHNNDTLSDTNHTSNHNKQSDLLFALETPAFLEQSGFTCIEHDAEDRYIADIVAATSLNEEEYWNAHNVANTVPWIDAGDELDRMIDGFDHGTIESKKVFSKKTKTGALAKGFDHGSNGGVSDGEIDEHSVERVNIQREFQYAMRTGHVVRCRLIRRRQFEDWDEGDTHFRICESQFMRSCTHGGVSSHGMQSTLKEVIYVINPKLIKQFQAKKKAMKRRLGGSGVNTILAWHGTPSSNTNDIVTKNFRLSHLGGNCGNKGLFGAGIYFSEFANVSQGYGDGLLLCKIMLGKTYKMNSPQVGCALKQGHDSHMSGGGKYGTEIVIFNMDQILPCYIVKR